MGVTTRILTTTRTMTEEEDAGDDATITAAPAVAVAPLAVAATSIRAPSLATWRSLRDRSSLFMP